MPDPRQKLYNALSSNFDLGSQEEFNAKMDNPESRKKLYSAVSKSFDLGSFEEFEGKVSPLKKKNSSIAPEQKSASVPKTGSLDGKGTTQGFPEIDTNSVAPGMGVQPKEEYLAKQKLKSDKIKALETSFYDATQNNDDAIVAEQRTQDAIAKTGVWNTIKDVSKKTLNNVIDFASATSPTALGLQRLKVNEDPLATEKEQVRRESLKNKEKLSDLEVNSRAAEIYKQKEKDNLFIDRANSFLDNLDPKDKELLRQDRALKATHLQENNAKKLKVVSAMQTVANEKIKEYQAIEKQLKDLKEKKQSFPEDLFKKYTALGTEIKNIGSSVNQYQNEILENKSDLGTAQEEFDLFSREYGDIKNFVGNLSASAKELGNGLLGGYLWFGDTVAGLAGKHQDKDYNEAINIATKNVADNSESIKKDREQLRKPVESIESVEGFVNYASDLMANQIPNLVVTSTGAKGLALIGTVSAGQKFSEMNTEVRQGKAKYSAAQMAFAPLLYGSAEVVSELPTLSILKKAGRVLESVAKNEAELITKTAKQKAIDWAKDYGVDMTKEMSGEQFTNFAQNFNDKYVLGKNEVGLLDNTGQVFKDTFTLTSMLKAAPHVFGAVVKPFQSSGDLGKLDENSRKIIAFSKQLDTEGLTDTEKSVIQKQIDKATKESAVIVKNTIGKIKDMPSRLYDEVVSLNQQAGEIKTQAKAIADGNLSNKEQLLKGLAEDYNNLQEKRTAIIEGNTTEVDVLPLKEQEKLKKQAMEDLVTELNPDGKKNITITNEQVVERANEILKESDKNEVNLPLSTSETQENGLKVEGNLPQTQNTNEAAPPTNTPADGNIRLGDNAKEAQGQNNDLQPTTKSPTNKGEVGTKLAEINQRVFGLDEEKSKANTVVMEKMIETMAERDGISKEEMFDKIDFEKADATTTAELSKKGKALFQIAGENANLKEELRDKLKRAQELENKGKSEREIWIATGWQKGADGKWRVEFDDSKMQLKDGYESMRAYPLEEAIDYKELFDLYPQLKEVKFSVIPRLGSMNGAFMPAKNLIMINGQLTPAEVKSTLLHEIQHIIQKEEGFATGGTPKMAVDYLNSKINRLKIAKNVPSFVAKAADKLSKSLFTGIDIQESKENFIKEINKAKNKLSKGEWEVYQSIAGEVESRNVQNRMNMTAEERKNTPLSETETKILPKEYSDDPNQHEKIGRDEQIVLFQGEQGAMLAEDGKFIIYALTDANVSTPLHEMAHVYEHYLTDAERTAILENAGHETWSRDTSEHFARGFEKYLADGVAPNPEMKTAFENFKKWMAEIYNGIKASDIAIKISPEMNTIFDVILGGTKTESKIAASGIGTENYKNKIAQVEGRKREITIGNGTKIKGQYKVVSSDDILASHNEGNFSKTNGYPTNERGETINDRNYETDKNSQSEVIKIAQDFDGRAIQQTPVVTKDGIVVDGNNRVMSRKLSAKKGTDTQYKETLLEEAEMYGIDPNEISGISNPVLVFEAENNLPYNTETLAMFNKQDKKEKSNAGRAVEYSKTLSEKAKRQIAEIYDEAERPSDVTGDPKLVKKLRDILINNSIIETNEVPRYFDVDKGVMTKEGVVLMENIALGSVFNENTIQTLSLPGMGDIKNKILQSLVGLINNSSLQPEFSLSTELSNAVEVIYQLKTTKQTIEEYLDQPDLFGEKLTPNLDEYAVLLAISDAGFKNWLKNYNNNIGQPDLFKTEGDPITTKRDITNETARTKRKQVPENLRSDAQGNAGENGQPNGKIEGEVKNEPNDKKDDGEIEHGTTHDRTKSLVSERVPYAKIKPKNSPKKLVDIIKNVSEGLKSTLIYGRSGRRNSAGSYNPRNTLVRIRRAGDIDTVAHELGHLLDDRHNLLGTIPKTDETAILRQLKWYSERGGSNPPSGLSPAKKAEYLEREGLAEFIRSYVANPEQTKVLAPELLAHFETTIDNQTQAVLKQFSNDFLDYANADGIEKTLANVEEIELPNKNSFIEWVRSFRKSNEKLSFSKMDKFYAEMANSNHFGIKAFKTLVGINGKTDLKSHENFEIMSRVFLGINGKLENIFASGMINAKNEKLKAEGGVFSKDEKGRTVYKGGTAMNVEWLINGLDTNSEETLKREMNEVIAMAIAQRTIEYAKKLGRVDGLTGIGGSLDSDLSVAIDTLADFSEMKKSDKAKYDRIKDGVDRYRQMADATLRYAVDKGRISEEQYAKIKEGNEYYVALNRNMELEPGEDMFQSFNTGTNGIGAAKEILRKVKGGTATIENPYLSLLKNMNTIIKEADRNEVMRSFVEPLKSTRQMGEGEAVNLAKVGRLANDGDKNTIKVFIDGQLEKWQFQEDIYSSLKNIESISSNPIMDFLGKPSQLIRWTVTNNPVFYARNIVKDTQARLVVSNNHSTIKDMFHNSGDKELFELYGGSQAGHLHTSKESYSKAMTDAAKVITKKGGIVLDIRKFGQKYAKFLQTGENLNRIAEFNRNYKVAKEKGMSDYDAGLYAAFEARDLMDFAVAGHTMREINKVIVFSNAGVQSIRKARKALLKDPAGFTYRTALYSVLPTLLLASLRKAMGDDEEYEKLPANQRDMFFNFKTPFTGDAWISIPKPYELGLISAFVDRASSKLRGHDEAFDGVFGTTLKTLMPFDESSFLGGLKPIIETQMNRDTFTDKAIVPEHEKGKLLELRKGTGRASFVGQNVSKMFKKAGMRVDPRNIDHILKGYGTYFANQGMAVTDLMKKERADVNFWITKTGFAKDVPTYNSTSVRKTTDLAVEIGKVNSKKMKSLRAKIETFYAEEDLAKRKIMIKEIYAESEKIRAKLETQKAKMLKGLEETDE